MIEGPVCLIVNPHAGGGRATRLLPGVEAALRAQGRPFRVAETMSMQHARELAREARDNGEIVAAMGGDGIIGAIAGELRDGTGLLAVLPGGRGNDFARKLKIPSDPVEAVKLLQDGEEKRIDLAEAGGLTYLGILSAGFDSDVVADRPRDAPEARHVRLHLRRAARDRELDGGDLGADGRRRPARVRRLSASPSPTPACSAAGCSSRPRPRSRTGCSTS